MTRSSLKAIILGLVLLAVLIQPIAAEACSFCEFINLSQGDPGPQGPQGPQGEMNQTPNMTPGASQDLNDYYRNDTSKALFGAFLYRNVNDGYLSIIGGGASPPYSGNLQLYGGDNPAQSGGFIMSVGNDSGTAPAVVFSALGRTDDPELSLSGNKIVSLKDPTNPQDAATKAYVDLINGTAGINNSYYLRDTSLPLTGEKVKRDVDNDLLTLYGGDAIAGGTGIISLYGKTNANPYAVEVVGGDAAGVGNLLITGWKDGATPLMDMTGYNITGIKTITVASDAVNKSYVDAAITGGDTSHNLLLNLTYDDHPQYANLYGRAGGQTLTGNPTSGSLTLNGSSQTIGQVIMNPRGGTTKIYDTLQFYFVGAANPYATFGSSSNGVEFILLNNTASSNVRFSSRGNLNFIRGGGFAILESYVGVGTSAPTSMFDVTGSTRFRNCSGTPTMDAGGNMTCASDEKLKTAIGTYISPSAKLESVVTKHYQWSEASGFDTKRVNVGFSAQDVQAVYPECVIARDDVTYVQDTVKGEPVTREVKTGTQTLALDDKCLIAVLWNAAKDQQQNNTAQQMKINSLEARLTALEHATVKA